MSEKITPTGTPRWVKVTGAVALLFVVLLAVLLLTGRGGEHGPGRHGQPTETTPHGQRGDHVPAGEHTR